MPKLKTDCQAIYNLLFAFNISEQAPENDNFISMI